MSEATDTNMNQEVLEENHKIKTDTPFLPLLYAMDTFSRSHNDSQMPFIFAIDGLCGSGKTSLAKELSNIYDCNVFHMDDFYLPFEMRTRERLEQPGGNVHYERFNEEVLIPLLKQETITYAPFQCFAGNYGEPRIIKPKAINIVEGSYSLHPYLSRFYNCKVFLTINKQVQISRIRKRSGEEKLSQFLDKWIPMENRYFTELHIQSSSDLVMDTSDLW
ncbi:uridine kinase family protein [Anaerocolumna sp.]|uniref:uridine kinase family protein n=1 Tax=Anaerocolumna sp. TaxID=2041569 RepID=UPI0028A83B62|nr:uridine kinase [Anaerocolumna sp.]